MEDDDLEKKNLYLHGTYYVLRIIKLFYDLGEYEMAYDEAMEGYRHIDHIIPDEIWLKIGGEIDASGNKVKRRKLGRRERIEMDYKKCIALMPIFREVIRRLPPKDKLYSKPWLGDLYKTLLRSRDHYIKELDVTKFKTAPQIDKQLVKECFKWLVKFKEHIYHWRKQKVDIAHEYRLISHMTLTYAYFLKQRDKKGVGSFIDIVYNWY